MTPLHLLAGILGLGLLVVVHETGHLLAARASGMRVVRFSIGIGPALVKYQSKRSETEYQISLFPVLAYVQIAGMQPFEQVDPDDKGSYANGSLFARIFAILAGPLANYVFASVLFFLVYMIGGVPQATTGTKVEVLEGPAKAAKMLDGDTVVAIGGVKVDDFEKMRQQIVKSPGKPLVFEVERGKERLQLTITPKNEKNEGKIGVTPITNMVPVTAREAGIKALVLPYQVVKSTVVGLGRILTLQEKPDLKGPIGIVKETSKAASRGWLDLTYFLGILSACLGGFNALPFPGLDGGRLAFLSYELVTRRRPNGQIEVLVHTFGIVMLLMLIAVVTFSDVRN